MLLSLASCETTSPRPSTANAVRASQRIDEIQLFTHVTAMNWDDKPGPDGVPVTVYLFRLDQAEPVVLQSGTLTFLLYGGRLSRDEALAAEPLHTWRYTAAELQSTLNRSMIGWGYKVPLDWGDRIPTAPHVTLIARYQPDQGQAIHSAATSLAVTAQ